ncbi:MAG TPA: metalloregulator ArsR/SmtB family transcription factor [Candidatus Pacearchaeota archaeon]|nr:metalloregulator ArsR/SmtB family transcription factor [Candidatus Pacearchaeota archaeon]HOK94312.1 metalloregulator ArsR/SmtB family transcription factor [Candidatus Pacearchaeota archaeon]HPO75332.1 metalloregulator ArsR/SmtB family transcription factor [Candidatus Pacearchaeota archaeon]
MKQKRKEKHCSQCFNSIGERTRMKIIQYLKEKPRKVKEICQYFSLTQPTISHHLKILKNEGIVLNQKKGRENYYFLNKKYPCKKCSIFNIPFKV